MSFTLFRIGLIWHYRFTIDGERIRKTTGETVRAKAEAVARDAYEAAKLRARGEEPEPLLEDLVHAWLDTHQPPICSRSHVQGIERFGRLHLGSLRGLKVGALTTTAVETARIEYLDAGHAPSSANQWLTYLKILCKYAIKRRMIRTLAWEVKELKVQAKPKRLLPVGQTSTWVTEIDRLTVRDVAMAVAIRLMLGLGLRQIEVLGARWEWLDFDRALYTPGETKGREAVARPVPGWLLEALRPMAQPEGYIVPASKGGLITPQRVLRVMNKACAAVGMPRLTPHRLRGTYATLLSERGVPIQDIQMILGHKDIRTTVGYLQSDMARVIRAQISLAESWNIPGLKTATPPHSNPSGD